MEGGSGVEETDQATTIMEQSKDTLKVGDPRMADMEE